MSYESFPRGDDSKEKLTLPTIELVGTLEPEDPLLKLREKEVEELNQVITDNKFTILRHIARSGSSSLMNAIENRRAPEELVIKLTSAFEYDFKEACGKIIENSGEIKSLSVIVEESGNLDKLDENGLRELENLFKLAREFETQKGAKIHFVFLTHDGMRKDGQKVKDVVKNFLQKEGSELFPNLNIAENTIKTFDQEKLGQVFDNIAERSTVNKMPFPKELMGYRQELLDYCYSPQQINNFLAKYLESYAADKNHETALQEGKSTLSEEYINDALESSVRTGGGKKMFELIRRIGDVGKGGFKKDELSKEEQEFLEYYSPYHFIVEKNDKLYVQGESLYELAKNQR